MVQANEMRKDPFVPCQTLVWGVEEPKSLALQKTKTNNCIIVVVNVR